MIQFNLLPDVKKQYIKAKRMKRLILSTAILASGVSLGVVVLIAFYVQIGQKSYINDLTDDIQTEANVIANIEDIDTILTVQNQLTLLPALHGAKPETSRIFSYLSQIIPTQAVVTDMNLDLVSGSISLRGGADSIATINKMVDTIKVAQYTVDDGQDKVKVFGITSNRLSGDNDSASYDLTMTVDPVIFDNTKKITIIIDPLAGSSTEPAVPAGGN